MSKPLAAAMLAAVALAALLPRADATWGVGDGHFAKHFGGKFGMGGQQQQPQQAPVPTAPVATPSSPTTGAASGGSGTGCRSVIEARVTSYHAMRCSRGSLRSADVIAGCARDS